MNSLDPSLVYFSFLDVETTGLDPASGDRVCEIAIVKTLNTEIVDKYVTLINPGIAIPPRAVAIHGISDTMVKRAPFFRQVSGDILEMLKDSVIVAHNAAFDLGFLEAELKNLSQTLPEYKVIDTLGIARRYYDFPNNSLGVIAKSIGIRPEGEHRALADVLTTKGVFEYFLSDLGRRGIRLKRLKDLLKLQGKAVELKTSRELVLPKELEDALRVKGKLRIKYLSAYKEETSTRVIEPFEISVSRASTYIHAFCHLRKERCTFRLDRILDLKAVS